MNRNILIVLAGAIVIAVAVAFIVQLSVGGEEEVVSAPVQSVQILVAAKALPVGKELVAGDLSWQDWPKDSVFAGAVVRKDGKAAGKAAEGRLARSIAKGEPVLKTALLGAGAANFVSASLEAGMRALAIKVSASSMVAGFIGPGDFVDVILTYKQSVKVDDDEDPAVQETMQRTIDKFATETIIQNVKILAVDQISQRPDESKVKVGKTVTLAVSAQQAEKLSLAAKMGGLTLALRGVGDNSVDKASWPLTTDARMTSLDDSIFEEYKKVKNDSGNDGRNVRIYNGDQIQKAYSE